MDAAEPPNREAPDADINAPPQADASTWPLPSCAVDTHTHLYFDGLDVVPAANDTVAAMDSFGVALALILPPPYPDSHPRTYDLDVLEPARDAHPNRLRILGGGGTINPLIHRAAADPHDFEANREAWIAELQSAAHAVIAAGAAGFGELTALHLSMNPSHPFLWAPPDHPLFVELASIAGAAGMPIDLHMEAVVAEDYQLDPLLFGEPNPAGVIPENISALERLLSSQPSTRIVWTHIGWDNTGMMSPELIESLLERHDNLYLALRDSGAPGDAEGLHRLSLNGEWQASWLTLILSYPDRFLVGADEFIGEAPGARPQRSFMDTWNLVARLPSDVRQRIACDNPRRVYRID